MIRSSFSKSLKHSLSLSQSTSTSTKLAFQFSNYNRNIKAQSTLSKAQAREETYQSMLLDLKMKHQEEILRQNKVPFSGHFFLFIPSAISYIAFMNYGISFNQLGCTAAASLIAIHVKNKFLKFSRD